MRRVLDIAGRAGGIREHPLPDAFGQIRDGGPAVFENGRELIGDGSSRGTPVLVSSTRKASASMWTRSRRSGRVSQ